MHQNCTKKTQEIGYEVYIETKCQIHIIIKMEKTMYNHKTQSKTEFKPNSDNILWIIRLLSLSQTNRWPQNIHATQDLGTKNVWLTIKQNQK